MKHFVKFFVLAVLVVAMVGCTTVAPMGATSNPVGKKVGEASANYLFAGFPLSLNQDMSIAKAAANGGITKISTYDLKVLTYFGVFSKVTTTVTGE
ncbi:MAG TPA: TRL domain-containing protein [Treponemataceae bacterium]|nr:TRL domain-containing protein [Treponemataceae bacterium]